MRTSTVDFQPPVNPATTLVALFCFSILPVCFAQQAITSLPLLTDAGQVRKLSREEAQKSHPVRFRGVLTYFHPRENQCFIQDDSGAISIEGVPADSQLKAGSLVEVEGVSAPGGLSSVIAAPRFTVVEEAAPAPVARLSTIERLLTGIEDCQWVETRGVVQSATVEDDRLVVYLRENGRKLRVSLRDHQGFQGKLQQLVDDEVRVRGICATRVGPNLELSDVWLLTPSWSDLTSVGRAPATPSIKPVVQAANLSSATLTAPLDHRVRMQGRFVELLPDGSWLVEDETARFKLWTKQRPFLRPDDRVDFLGFASVTNGTVVLEDAICRVIAPKASAAAATNAMTLSADDYLPVLHEVRRVLELAPREALRGYPVRLRGVVTYYDKQLRDSFIQDATGGIFVSPKSVPVTLGQIVDVEGFTAPGNFAPIVVDAKITPQGRGNLPPPHQPAIEQLVSGREHGQWAEIEGVVRSVSVEEGYLFLHMAAGGVRFKARVPNISDRPIPADLVGSIVRMRGVCGTVHNAKRQAVGLEFYVPGIPQLRFQQRAPADPYSLDTRPIDSLLQFNLEDTPGQRVKIEGVVTFQRLGESLIVQDDTGATSVQASNKLAVERGTRVEVVGFPALDGNGPVLQDAIFRRVSDGRLPEPAVLTAQEALRKENHFKLVRLTGRLLDHTVRPNEQVLVMQTDDLIFPALLDRKTAMGALEHLREGSLLQVTGIAFATFGSDQTSKDFRVVLCSPADVVVLKQPSWWTLWHSLAVISLLVGVIVAAFIWVALLQRRVQQKTGLIRQRLEREAALEERYRELFENASDMVYTHDLEGNYTSINKAGERILGYSRDGFTQLNVFDVVVPEQRASTQQMIARKLSGGGVTTYEVQALTKDGRRVALEVSTRLILEGGKPVGVHGVGRDITERKKAETRGAVFSSLGHQLSSARRPEEAAKIIVEVADQLLGWHACYLHVFTPDQKGLIPVVNFDTVDGRRVAVASAYLDMTPSATDVSVRSEGRKLILRDESFVAPGPLIPFGDKGRPSASLMFVPIRNGPIVIGILSIQSYTRQAYSEADLETLQALADHCGGALERIRAEEALRESEEHYRNLVEGSMQGIMIHQDSIIQFANPALADTFGYSNPAELVGQNIWESLTAPEARAVLRARTEACLRGELIPIFHGWQGIRRDGTRIWIESGGSAISWKGRPAVLAFFLDVSERTQAEEALRQSEERFSKAFQATPVSIAITNGSDGRFLDANDSFLQIFGFTRDDVVGCTAGELGLWDKPEDRNQLSGLLQNQPSIRNLEWRFRTRSAEIKETLISVETIELDNAPCLLWIIHDLTERLRLESQLRHAQKLEAVGQLAAGVAHDFNNIMTIIQGHTSLLLSGSGLELDTADSLKEVSAAADRAANLTRQLLAFSRKQIMQLSALDLNQVVRHVAKMLRRLVGDEISLECSYGAGLPLVCADATMMEQTIVNLAVNARDAMPKGGKLAITSASIDIDEASAQRRPEARAGQFVCLTVADTGCGMDAVTLSKIFEPFFTTKEVGKGTGLGLSMVYGIVKQHQGWIEVTSEPGRGTTFNLFLPADQNPSGPLPKPSASLGIFGGTETILVVEDEPSLRDLVGQLLRRDGYKVIPAGTGSEALRLWEQHENEIDLLLTDMKMPGGISGQDLAARLQAAKPALKVIFTSGYSLEAADGDLVLQTGINFLSKPYQPAKLARMIRACLDETDMAAVPEVAQAAMAPALKT
jgi:two-component system cell cycle sensor histidine kinase/response regulator CckA